MERYLPLMIHLQVSEQVHAILQQTFPQKLLKYEKSKLREILNFIDEYKNYDPNIDLLI